MAIDISDCNKSRDELISIIRQWVVGPDAERDRQILIRNLVDGIHYEALAEEMQLSKTTIKRVVKRKAHRVLIHM